MAAMRERIDNIRRRRAEELLSSPEAATAFDGLYKDAFDRFGTTCLWNCYPPPTVSGMRTIMERLMVNGDRRAWFLAAKIKEKLADAPRQLSI